MPQGEIGFEPITVLSHEPNWHGCKAARVRKIRIRGFDTILLEEAEYDDWADTVPENCIQMLVVEESKSV